jgi:cation diffusion facilitator CzcD-associated flavoprotein CzcO
MTSNTDHLDAIVIGAGWIGLGSSYYLAQAGLKRGRAWSAILWRATL